MNTKQLKQDILDFESIGFPKLISLSPVKKIYTFRQYIFYQGKSKAKK